MKVTFNIPDSSSCIGMFINYKNPDLKSTITTTNALFETKNGMEIIVTSDGKIENKFPCDDCAYNGMIMCERPKGRECEFDSSGRD